MEKVVYLLILSLIFVNFSSIAQETEAQKTGNKLIVSGNITDSNGLPLIGANIAEKGTPNETTTNFDGKFSLEVETGTILSISYIGFKTVEILIEPKAKINFILKENHNPLDLNSEEVSTRLTRAEMRKIRRAINKRPYDLSEDVKQLFGILQVIAKE